jgi:ABC-type sugar transport system permease subunit
MNGRSEHSPRLWPWLAPSLVLVTAVVVYPAVEMVRTSLLDLNSIGLAQGFAGLGNFQTLFDEPALGHVVRNTVVWVVVVVGVTLLVSMALAQLLNAAFPGRRLVRWALIVPWAASLVMTATIWRYIYERDFGILNRLLSDLGLIDQPVDWFRDTSTAFWCLIVIGIIVSIPFTTYVLLAGLQTIPSEIREAARVDGAGPLRAWRQVTLPLLRPSIVVAVVLNTIYVFNSFPIIWVITGNLPGFDTDTTITFMYKLAFTAKLDAGEAAALAVFNVAVLLVVVTVYLRWMRLGDDQPGGTVKAARPGRWRRTREAVGERIEDAWRPASLALSRWGSRLELAWRPFRSVGLALVGAVVGLFFLAPYVFMALSALKTDADLFHSPALYLPRDWAWSNFVDVWDAIPLADYLRNSLIIAAVATVIVLVVSLPAAYVVARQRFRGRRAFLYLVLVTQMLAPVALVVGIYREVILADTYLKNLDPGWGAVNTFWALILINAAFTLAFSIWILNGYLASIPEEVEEAAMLDGLGRFGVLTRIVLPLAKPGIVTAIVFTFIQVWNEFVIARTIFNDPTTNKQTLTVGITQFVGLYETQYQYLFVASLIGIVPVVVLFIVIERHLVSGLTAGSVR